MQLTSQQDNQGPVDLVTMAAGKGARGKQTSFPNGKCPQKKPDA
ncbi:hypothetical protein [Variovorax gossypii]